MKLAHLALLLAACGGTNAPNTSSTASPGPATAAAPEATAETVLRIAKAELTVVEDETYVYSLAPDGLVSAMGDDLGFLTVPVARLSANGELRQLDGTLVATIAKDGAISIDGRPVGMSIDEDGVMTGKGELVVAIGPDGAASGPLAQKSRMSYQGDADARRALLFAAITSMSMTATPKVADAPAQAPASTTIPACDAYRTTATKAKTCRGFDDTWGRRLAKGVARVDRYATTPPIEGTEAAAASCTRAIEKVKLALASPSCQL